MQNISPKSRAIVLVLNIFFGLLGIHRMYVGKIGTGVLQLLFTMSGIGLIVSAIWAFLDFLMILIGSFTDAKKVEIKDWKI